MKAWKLTLSLMLLLGACLLFVSLVSGEEKPPAGGKLREVTNSIGVKLVLIPAGEFQMGSPESDKDAEENEKPRHRVKISKPFYLGKYEVTQGEWKAVMKTEPWKGKKHVKEGDDYPATYIGWKETVEFCQKLSQKEGKTYRLPTEAEWEYACRGGKPTQYHFGHDESDLGKFAWYGGILGNGNAKDEQYAHRVGQKKSNPFGLYDMNGNVWEWCSDWYNAKYYANSPTDNPQGLGEGSLRVFRGGSWDNRPGNCRSAFRDGDVPSYRSLSLGFRLARNSNE